MGEKIPFKPRPRHRKAEIIDAIEKAPHLSDRAIAVQFGVSRTAVMHHRHDAGLPRNPRGTNQNTGAGGA